jgi:hypothetical protein
MERMALKSSRKHFNSYVNANRESILSLLEMVRSDPAHKNLVESNRSIQHAIGRLETIHDWLGYAISTRSTNKPEGLQEFEKLIGAGSSKTGESKKTFGLVSILLQESQVHQATLRALFQSSGQ